MAEGQEDRSADDLTEEASPYRLEENRRKGIVAQSREVTGLAALLGAGVTAYAMSPTMGAQMAEFMREVFRTDLSARLDLGSTVILSGVLLKALKIMAAVILPVCVVGFIIGVISSYAQIGNIFSFDPIQPDFSKVDPLKGIKRFFSLKQAKDGVRLVIKMIILLFVAYGFVKTEVLNAPMQYGNEPITMAVHYGQIAKPIFLWLIGILSIFAAIDLIMQRREMNQGLKMTKQEAKQEHKEREGDPAVKARIRAVQREVARRRMMAAVKKADVIITNPTHIAIAIVYDKDAMAAPRVVAKGADLIAQRIKKIAAEHNIPMVENVPLARTLYKTVKLNGFIPRALYQAVAEVLAYVYRLKRGDF